jgi:hypothetical protein
VTADGSGSFDPEGGRIASYRFDFGDGTVVGPQSGPTAAHTYAAGDWTATLTVTDSLGASGTTTVAITVTPVAGNQPPTASLVVTPSSGTAPLAVTADGSGSSDPEGGRIASYRFDFGDGTVVGPQPGATAAHTYAAGNWTVTLTVTDSLGATGTAPRAVAVTGNRPPTASLVVTPSSGNAPLAVTANGSASVDPDGGRIFSYRFDFGDGTVVGPQPGATATHTYAKGNFTATLTVTDSVGASGTATAMIRAKKPGPPGASLVETPSADSASAQASSNVIPATVDFAPRMTPNPVRTFAELAFDLQCPVPVWFRVFDIEGRLVRTVSSGTPMTAGRKVLVLDGLADGGAPLRSGVYLYDVRAGSQRAVGRFVVMR